MNHVGQLVVVISIFSLNRGNMSTRNHRTKRVLNKKIKYYAYAQFDRWKVDADGLIST